MVEELNNAITEYLGKWQSLTKDCSDIAFFEQLLPTSVAWKTENLDDFNARLTTLRDYADQIHLAWVNERWLATIHLRETTLVAGLTVVKIMQRRPASTDAIGLDHIDFHFDTTQANAKDILSAEANLKWSEETNGDNCKWLSIWFDGTEAKIRSDTVLDVCAREMLDLQSHILSKGEV